MRVLRMAIVLLATVALALAAPGVAQAAEPGERAGWSFGFTLPEWLTGLIGRAPATAPAPTSTPTSPAPGTECLSLEGCYERDDMARFFADGVALVEAYALDVHPDQPLPEWRLLDADDVVSTPCGEVTEDVLAVYCPGDATVYVADSFLWAIYSETGDASSVFVFAHEWGHHVQNVTGGIDVEPTVAVTLAQEKQADCIGGSFLGDLQDRGALEADDFDDLNMILPHLASAEDMPERTHGTLSERRLAAYNGIENGIGACDAYHRAGPPVS